MSLRSQDPHSVVMHLEIRPSGVLEAIFHLYQYQDIPKLRMIPLGLCRTKVGTSHLQLLAKGGKIVVIVNELSVIVCVIILNPVENFPVSNFRV